MPPVVPPPGVDEAEQRRRAEEEAARASTVFFQSRQGSPASATPGATPGLPGFDAAGAARQPTAQDKQLAFLNAAAERRTVTPDRVTPPASPFVLHAGAVISAALMSGMRCDLMPNGRSIVLERQLGADRQGYAGLEDGVDCHWWDLAKAAAPATLLGVGAEFATDDNDRLIRAIRDGAQDTINQAAQQIVQRQLQVAPTLTIRPGFPVRVIVTCDLVLEPYRS
ncbi:hypothetical protein GCM10017653_11050 [Ancylobacter defluvii]|uniref:Type IV secretion system protein VirB10 n=1 Tax=Ancylobacter defluvii TaxID=1282440 RepID=A0A9W6NA24_9HYPH|nr:hypothetical protein GCM10017653_11050 [Ancylobacter defluvii]